MLMNPLASLSAIERVLLGRERILTCLNSVGADRNYVVLLELQNEYLNRYKERLNKAELRKYFSRGHLTTAITSYMENDVEMFTHPDETGSLFLKLKRSLKEALSDKSYQVESNQGLVNGGTSARSDSKVRNLVPMSLSLLTGTTGSSKDDISSIIKAKVASRRQHHKNQQKQQPQQHLFHQLFAGDNYGNDSEEEKAENDSNNDGSGRRGGSADDDSAPDSVVDDLIQWNQDSKERHPKQRQQTQQHQSRYKSKDEDEEKQQKHQQQKPAQQLFGSLGKIPPAVRGKFRIVDATGSETMATTYSKKTSAAVLDSGKNGTAGGEFSRSPPLYNPIQEVTSLDNNGSSVQIQRGVVPHAQKYIDGVMKRRRELEREDSRVPERELLKSKKHGFPSNGTTNSCNRDNSVGNDDWISVEKEDLLSAAEDGPHQHHNNMGKAKNARIEESLRSMLETAGNSTELLNRRVHNRLMEIRIERESHLQKKDGYKTQKQQRAEMKERTSEAASKKEELKIRRQDDDEADEWTGDEDEHHFKEDNEEEEEQLEEHDNDDGEDEDENEDQERACITALQISVAVMIRRSVAITDCRLLIEDFFGRHHCRSVFGESISSNKTTKANYLFANFVRSHCPYVRVGTHSLCWEEDELFDDADSRDDVKGDANDLERRQQSIRASQYSLKQFRTLIKKVATFSMVPPDVQSSSASGQQCSTKFNNNGNKDDNKIHHSHQREGQQLLTTNTKHAATTSKKAIH